LPRRRPCFHPNEPARCSRFLGRTARQRRNRERDDDHDHIDLVRGPLDGREAAMRYHLHRRAAVVTVLLVVWPYGCVGVAGAQDPSEETEYDATDEQRLDDER
jgi:hypothetical protein